MANEAIVHVIDDDQAMRESLAFLLDVRGFTTRLHESAEAFLEAAPDLSGGCILTDVRMPDMTGLELIRALRESGRACPVIVMTGHADVPLAVEAMKAGVVDFIEKPFDDEALVGAIRLALARPAADASPDSARTEALRALADLSPRENEVLAGVIAGKANKIIAFELGISPRTVEIYRAHLMSKTGARNLSDLMRLALAAGL